MTEQQDLPAGRFSSWLHQIRSAQIKDDGIDVPCEACNACCRSSQFIHIRPEETETLGRIPDQLLFAAPRLPEGNVVLGYDENGCCPMLIDGGCSVYAYRPRTCRHYDCRIFPATGIAPGDEEKVLIAQHIRRWKFSYPSKCDRNQQSAVRDAARFLQEYSGYFPAGAVPSHSTQLAILAIKVYDVFLKSDDESDKTRCVSSAPELASAVMEANQKFETMREKLLNPL